MNLFDIAAGIGASAPQVFQNVGALANIQSDRDKLDLAREQAVDARNESRLRLEELGKQSARDQERLGLEKDKFLVDKKRADDDVKLGILQREKANLELGIAARANEQDIENRKRKFLPSDIIKRFPEHKLFGKETEEYIMGFVNNHATEAEIDSGIYSKNSIDSAKKDWEANKESVALLTSQNLSKTIEGLEKKIGTSTNPLEKNKLIQELADTRKNLESVTMSADRLMAKRKLEVDEKKAAANKEQMALDAAGGDPVAKKALNLLKQAEIDVAVAKHANDPNTKLLKAQNAKIALDELHKDIQRKAYGEFTALRSKLFDANGTMLEGNKLAAVLKTHPLLPEIKRSITQMSTQDDIGKFIGGNIGMILSPEDLNKFTFQRNELLRQATGGPETSTAPGIPMPSTPVGPASPGAIAPPTVKYDPGFLKTNPSTEALIAYAQKLSPEDQEVFKKDLIKAKAEEDKRINKSTKKRENMNPIEGFIADRASVSRRPNMKELIQSRKSPVEFYTH